MSSSKRVKHGSSQSHVLSGNSIILNSQVHGDEASAGSARGFSLEPPCLTRQVGFGHSVVPEMGALSSDRDFCWGGASEAVGHPGSSLGGVGGSREEGRDVPEASVDEDAPDYVFESESDGEGQCAYCNVVAGYLAQMVQLVNELVTYFEKH
jgi:hypothetical protein